MKLKKKYHGVMATLRYEKGAAVLMDITHPDYGLCPGLWVPKSIIHDDSLDVIEEAEEGDVEELFIQGWWFRKAFSEGR